MQYVVDYEVLGDLGRDRRSEWLRARRWGRGSPYRTATADTVLRRFFEGRPRGGPDLSARLRHPNLWGPLRWIDPDTCEVDRLYGWSLRTLLAEGPVPPAAAVAITRDMCAAVDHYRRTLKAAGHVPTPHGAVAPQHIVVTSSGVARLEEPFSIRRPTTRPGGPEFDLAFLTPEQARGRANDVHVDVFQLGLLLRSLLEGDSPFRRETAGETLVAARVCQLPPLRVDVPPVLEQVLARTLGQCNQARPPSPQELDWNLELVELAADWSPGRGRGAVLDFAERCGEGARLAPVTDLSTPDQTGAFRVRPRHRATLLA